MRHDSPAVYACKGKGSDRTMHHWARVTYSDAVEAECVNCGIVLKGEDAAEVFTGAETPIGMLATRDTIELDGCVSREQAYRIADHARKRWTGLMTDPYFAVDETGVSSKVKRPEAKEE